MANLTLRSVKGQPLTNNEIDTNFTELNSELATKLTATDYNAVDILEKLKLVDSSGSGLDADFLDGKTTAFGNTPDTVVIRDINGSFSANTITATVVGNLIGNADTVTNGVVTTISYNNPSWITSLAGSKVTNIPNTSLANSSISINGSAIPLGGSINILATPNIWQAQQTFRDHLFSIIDDADPGKSVSFQLSGVSIGANRVLQVPDESGIIATRTYSDSVATSAGVFAAPPAAIMYFARSSAPNGWLKANGAAISRTAYSALFGVIGTYYGVGDGSTSFNIPDLRGEFLRGWDDGRGVDPGRGFGTWQDYDWKGLWLTDTGQNSSTGYVHNDVWLGKSTTAYNGRLFTGYWSNPSAHIGGKWGTEEPRPRNVALLACIKF